MKFKFIGKNADGVSKFTKDGVVVIIPSDKFVEVPAWLEKRLVNHVEFAHENDLAQPVKVHEEKTKTLELPEKHNKPVKGLGSEPDRT